MIHHFKNSLLHEREQAVIANSFYIDVLKAQNIKRFNSDNEQDMLMQKQDIDVQVNIRGTVFNISEKFRDKDYGDLYIEMYSKYPEKTGWLHTGKPHAIVYFTPLSVYWIVHTGLTDFCLNKLFPLIEIKWLDEIYASKQTIVTKKLIIDNFPTKISIIQAHNFEDSAWETIGISIGFDVLKHFGVKFKKHIRTISSV